MLSFSPSQSLSLPLSIIITDHHHLHSITTAPTQPRAPTAALVLFSVAAQTPARRSTSVRTTTAHPPLLLPRADCFNPITTRKIITASQAATKPPPHKPLPPSPPTALSDPPRPPIAAEPLPRRQPSNSPPPASSNTPSSPPSPAPPCRRRATSSNAGHHNRLQ